MRACISGNATRSAPLPGWQTKDWDDMWNWERLVCALERGGPQTTGKLGHMYGIGENVRGIKVEANRHLARYGLSIKSEKTRELDLHGGRIWNATYRLVDTRGEAAGQERLL